MSRWHLITCFTLLSGLPTDSASSAEWSIPLAGNTFRTGPTPGEKGILRNGNLEWRNPGFEFSTYFHIDRPATLDLSVTGHAMTKPSALHFTIGGTSTRVAVHSTESIPHPLGLSQITQPGYVRLVFRGTEKQGATFGPINTLIVSSETPGLRLDFVRNNEGNMFYWGRRGPSVHLRYLVPQDHDLQYAYNEITIPQGSDIVGSFFMANGFAEGYFGFQVNRPTERRVLFSIWSPFKTDRPSEIPEDQRIQALARGPGVHIGEFGNEGSGGQSYLVYPWQADQTYCFLTEVRPNGEGATRYTAWFREKTSATWFLIASFLRPKTHTHLAGFHSFLESFLPSYGYLERRGLYGNTWVGDREGRWHECLRARFSVDATGRGRHRLDFQGGAVGNRFFLKNGGFFSPSGSPGTTFTRASSLHDAPDIDLLALPRK